MRFGVMLIGLYEVEMAPAEIYERSLLQARAAVANNFDVLFAAQHYLSGPAAAMMQPLVLLANLAAEAKGRLYTCSHSTTRWPWRSRPPP